MTGRAIGEVEELTGVKARTLRYWETVIPGFAPQKDSSGRRVYSQREIDIISRMKYLSQEKKFTMEGARAQIISDMSSAAARAELFQAIHDLRGELSEMYLAIRKYRAKQ